MIFISNFFVKLLIIHWNSAWPRYMSSTLLRVAREHTSVVAVVGKGHLKGIKMNWEQPVEVSDYQIFINLV